MALRDRISLDNSRWTTLRVSLDTLAAHPTDRVCLDADLLRLHILAAFGITVDPNTLTWTTAHGDLHWANLTNSGCWILDTGAVAQLAAAAKLLRLVEHGDHPDLAAPLHQHARTLLDTYF
jgi:hypothetical protein